MMSLTFGQWIYIFTIAVLLLFAVVCNSLVIYCICKIRNLRTVTNILIGNLAVSDIILAGFVLPQRLHDISHEEDFHEGGFLCKMVTFGPVFVIAGSINTLVFISFERRRAIIDHTCSQMTARNLRWIVPLLWVIAMVVSIPTLLEYRVNEFTIYDGVNSSRTILSCGSQHMSPSFSICNAIFVAMVSYLLPVILMFRNYFQVACFVWKRGRQVSQQRVSVNNNDSLRLLKNRIKLVKMMVIVAVIFAVSWLPFFIMLLYAKITGKDASHDASGFVNLFLIAMATFSTDYNVILYVMYNPGFQGAILGIIKCNTFGSPRVSTAPRVKVSTVQGSSKQAAKEIENQ